MRPPGAGLRRARKLAYAVVAVPLTLVAINALVVVGEVVTYGTWWSDGRPAGLYREDTRPRSEVPDPSARPALRPGAHLRGLVHEVSVNALGFRGAELAEPKPANGLRIWCTGGSTTFDIYAPDDARAWPARVGARVQAALPGRAVEVVNAGIPGEVFTGNTLDLLAHGPRVRPDVVVVYGGPNDLRRVVGMPAPGAAVAHRPPEVTLVERLDVGLVRVLNRWAQAQGWRQADLPAARLREDQLAALRQHLEALLSAARHVGARPVLATHPLRAAEDATGARARRAVAETAGLLGMDAPSTIAAFRDYNRVVVALAAERGVPVADVRAAVPPDPSYWGDATHFRAPGSERAAEVVAEAIVGMAW